MYGKVYINNCAIPLDEFPKDLLSLSELYDICNSYFWVRHDLRRYDEIVSAIKDIAKVESRFVAAAELGIDEKELEDCNVCICLPSTNSVAILGKVEKNKHNNDFDTTCSLIERAIANGYTVTVDGIQCETRIFKEKDGSNLIIKCEHKKFELDLDWDWSDYEFSSDCTYNIGLEEGGTAIRVTNDTMGEVNTITFTTQIQVLMDV